MNCRLEGCENSLEGKRRDAQFCSQRCRSTQWNRDNREHAREYAAEFRRDHPHIQRFHDIKGRALRSDIPFDEGLTPEDFRAPAKCPLLGIPLEKSKGTASDNSPSVDRIIPELGYVRGNIQIISTKANRIKQDACWQEIQAVADGMRRISGHIYSKSQQED